MSNKRQPTNPDIGIQIHAAVSDYLASSTQPLMEESPQTKEKLMTDNTPPVTIVADTDPATPEDTVVTTRFNRKKIAKIAGAATAAIGVLLVTFGAGKSAGRDEFIEDVRRTVGDDEDDESTES